MVHNRREIKLDLAPIGCASDCTARILCSRQSLRTSRGDGLRAIRRQTTIRAGFGIFYDKPEGNIIFGQPGVVPFLQSVTYPGGFLGQALGGWELSGITRAQSGQPLTISGSQTIGPSGSGVTAFGRRANIVPGVPLYSGYACPPNMKCWFNPAAFAQEATTSAGNAGAGDVLGPGYYAWDLSLRKIFKLPREGMSLMFQADAFNAFNWTNWGNPGTSVTSGGFGQIGATNPPRNLQLGAKFAF